MQKKTIKARNEAAKIYASARKSAKENMKRVPKGELKKIIAEVAKKNNVNANDVSLLAIKRRVDRQSLECHHLAGGGQVSPLAVIEPIVVGIILQMAQIRQCLNPSKGLALVNSIIEGTKVQDDLKKWKQKNTPNSTGTVGKGYWRSFMKRYNNQIVSKRGAKYELNRQNWTTYANFSNMYNHAIDAMVDAGLAIELNEPVWMDRNGNVCSEEDAFGCKVHHKLLRPDMCMCGDEVGNNISMKGDGHAGGELLLTAKKSVGQRKCSTRNRKFTLIGLTAFSGEPVMCVIIVEGKLPNGAIEAGIDITVTPKGSIDDPDFIFNNSGNGSYYPGGPECVYRGKKVPALVQWNESASITTHILVEMLQTIDALNLFPRENNLRPFLLLDGHRSRLELPFLQYINTPKDHWVVCIGVPYGTAYWQVGDSKEQNGSFNIAITQAKQDLLETKDTLGLYDEGIVDTDLMPIINSAWKRSFGRVDKNRNAICDRGWYPLNKALLLDPDIIATRSDKEKTREYNRLNHIIFPTTFSNDNGTDSCESYLSIPNNLPNELNFSSGMSGFCLQSILSQQMLQNARSKLNETIDKGKILKDHIKKTKALSAGIIFKAGEVRLGKTVFDVHKHNLKEKKKKLNEKTKKDEKIYLENVAKAKAIFETNKTLEDMTIKELTTICKPLKRKEDGKMPNKKKELIEKFHEWNGRPAPIFEVDEIDEASIDDINDNVNNYEMEIL